MRVITSTYVNKNADKQQLSILHLENNFGEKEHGAIREKLIIKLNGDVVGEVKRFLFFENKRMVVLKKI